MENRELLAWPEYRLRVLSAQRSQSSQRASGWDFGKLGDAQGGGLASVANKGLAGGPFWKCGKQRT